MKFIAPPKRPYVRKRKPHITKVLISKSEPIINSSIFPNTDKSAGLIVEKLPLYSFLSCQDGRVFAHGPIAGEYDMTKDYPIKHNLKWTPGIDLNLTERFYILYEDSSSVHVVMPDGDQFICLASYDMSEKRIPYMGFGYGRESILFAKDSKNVFRLNNGVVESYQLTDGQYRYRMR